MAWQTIRYAVSGDVGVVTLHRPEALNTYSVRMRDELHELLSCIRAEVMARDHHGGAGCCEEGEVGRDAAAVEGVRALLFQGAGPTAFCAGADLSEFLTAPSVDAARNIRRVRDLWRLLGEMPAPLIAAVHGYVLGSGLEIALACDVRMAAADAVFGLPEMGLGILPGVGGTQRVPRTMAPAHALDMLLTGRRFDAHEALARGLITRVVPAARLCAQALELAQRLADAPAAALHGARQAIKQGAELSLAQGLRLEARLAGRLAHRTHALHAAHAPRVFPSEFHAESI